MKAIDLTGQRFCMLEVVSYSHTTNSRKYWKVKCDCGRFNVVAGSNLKSGSVKACGCQAPKVKDLTGERRGHLVAVCQVGFYKGKAKWRVDCDCGGSKEMVGVDFSRSGPNASCGCRALDATVARMTTHGMSNTPTYTSWSSMLNRVTNPNAADWQRYGGRGVRVCDSWRNFERFLSDMGPRPEGKTLDRFPNRDGNYEPGNCRWADARTQAENRESTRWVEYKGEKVSTLDLARKLGITWFKASKVGKVLDQSRGEHTCPPRLDA